MNSIVRFFALSLFVALAISAATGTFNSFTTNNASGAAAAVYTNGYVVLIAGAGWLIGDAMTLTATASITWATLVASTGTTGIGLVAVGCSSNNYASTATTLVGTAATANCPGDFATVYTAAPSSPASTTTSPAISGANLLGVGQAVKYTLTGVASPAATTLVGISISVNGGTATTVTTAGAAVASSGTGPDRYALSSLSYAFYVQTTSAAQVCFQTDAQHTANAGNCGTIVTTTKSANIFSAAITGFVAMIALIFFN